MTAHILWRRLDIAGHDAALVERDGDGWSLRGTALFRHADGPANIDYALDIAPDWQVRRGFVGGRLNGRKVSHRIERRPEGWLLDGVPQGLASVVDLDFGFTPATNFQQLQRLDLAIGQRGETVVAWFDIGAERLRPLPQVYTRQSASTYWYQSPENGFEALLELAPTGFVRRYPPLWEMED